MPTNMPIAAAVPNSHLITAEWSGGFLLGAAATLVIALTWAV